MVFAEELHVEHAERGGVAVACIVSDHVAVRVASAHQCPGALEEVTCQFHFIGSAHVAAFVLGIVADAGGQPVVVDAVCAVVQDVVDGGDFVIDDFRGSADGECDVLALHPMEVFALDAQGLHEGIHVGEADGIIRDGEFGGIVSGRLDVLHADFPEIGVFQDVCLAVLFVHGRVGDEDGRLVCHAAASLRLVLGGQRLEFLAAGYPEVVVHLDGGYAPVLPVNHLVAGGLRVVVEAGADPPVAPVLRHAAQRGHDEVEMVRFRLVEENRLVDEAIGEDAALRVKGDFPVLLIAPVCAGVEIEGDAVVCVAQPEFGGIFIFEKVVCLEIEAGAPAFLLQAGDGAVRRLQIQRHQFIIRENHRDFQQQFVQFDRLLRPDGNRVVEGKIEFDLHIHRHLQIVAGGDKLPLQLVFTALLEGGAYALHRQFLAGQGGIQTHRGGKHLDIIDLDGGGEPVCAEGHSLEVHHRCLAEELKRLEAVSRLDVVCGESLFAQGVAKPGGFDGFCCQAEGEGGQCDEGLFHVGCFLWCYLTGQKMSD